MLAKRLLSAVALTTLSACAFSAITLSANAKNGQVIAGTHRFEIKVTSEELITNVEFYVGDDLKDTDNSMPYGFSLDTINEQEGDIKVTFAAYNRNGESAKQSFTLKIDNEFAKGVQFHIDRTIELTRDGKLDQAMDAGRVALKIDKANNGARMAMARAQYAANRMDVAQKYAEDVLFSDASNTDAKALLAAINLRTAFSAPGSNAKERNEIIAKALKSAAETQASLLTDAADKVPLSADPKAIDVHLRARRFSQVASLLRGNWEKNIDNPALTNRLLYTLLMAGRTDEFRKVYSTFTKYGSPDGYSYALMAVVAQLAGDKAGTDSAEKEVILEDPNSQTTKLLQIYLALSKGQYANMATMIGDLEKAGVPTAVVNNYKASNAFLGNNFDLAAKSMREALLADPSSVPVLIEQGNQIFQSIGAQNLSGTDLSDRATLALAYFEAALASSPSSFEALCAITMTHILLGNNEKAVSFGRAAAAAGPEYAGSHFILSGALRLAQIEAQKTPGGRPQATAYRTEMEAALKRASELDARLKNIIAPGAQQAWGYLYRSGRMPILPLPPQS